MNRDKAIELLGYEDWKNVENAYSGKTQLVIKAELLEFLSPEQATELGGFIYLELNPAPEEQGEEPEDGQKDPVLELPRIRLVYTRRYYNRKRNKLGFVWYVIKEDGTVDEDSREDQFWYLPTKGVKNLVSPAGPGAIWEFPAEMDPETGKPSSVYSGYADYVGSWDNWEDRAVWDAVDRSAYQAKAREDLKRKQAREKPVEDALDVLRRAYQKVPVTQRRAFQFWIAEEVTRTPRKEG